MGWGRRANATLRELAALGFQLDSSATPRPRYRRSPRRYGIGARPDRILPHPSVRDYRTAGEPALGLLEMPITTVPLPRATDTCRVFKRYIGLSYKEPLSARP